MVEVFLGLLDAAPERIFGYQPESLDGGTEGEMNKRFLGIPVGHFHNSFPPIKLDAQARVTIEPSARTEVR